MSNKVCCNCRHCIRSRDTKYNIIVCRCEKHDRYLSYTEIMVGWCESWKSQKIGISGSAATDIQLKDPSCKLFEKRNEEEHK